MEILQEIRVRLIAFQNNRDRTMPRLLFCFCFLFLSCNLKAAMVCEGNLAMDLAGKKVDEFVKNKAIPVPRKYTSKLQRKDGTCHYLYSLMPISEGKNKVRMHEGIGFILNPSGEVVYVVSRPYIDKIKCSKEKFGEEYFRKELKILRQKNPGLPKEPDRYDVYLQASFNCTYIYLEHTAGKGVWKIPYDKRINTFYFDYLGGLYDYQKDTFKMDELK